MRTKTLASNTIEEYSRCDFAKYPTPLQRFDRLDKDTDGIKLWVKRDDLISFGFGGNKVRALDYIVADAVKRGSKTLITGAGVQSNHVRATAAAAAYLDLKCVAIYWGNAPENIKGNYYLTKMLGAEIQFTNDMDRRSVDSNIALVEQELMSNGALPYAIPRGGACALGVIAHMFAAQELYLQCEEKGVKPDLVTLAVGSGGTIAGWILAKRLYQHPWRIEGFTVSRPSSELSEIILSLINKATTLLKETINIKPEHIVIHDGFIGDGYGIPSTKGNATVKEVAIKQGVFFDPVYTGKAFAGLLEFVKSGHYKDVETAVFLHTGGEPALFA